MGARRRRLPAWVALLAALAAAGCLMPAKGTRIYVDLRAGRFWSGKGMLLEVSEDQKRCRVAVRDRALVLRKFWTDCAHVHARRER